MQIVETKNEGLSREFAITIPAGDIEVRIHGKHFGGIGSTAIYRTNDMAKIWKHSTDKIKKIEKNLQKLKG